MLINPDAIKAVSHLLFLLNDLLAAPNIYFNLQVIAIVVLHKANERLKSATSRTLRLLNIALDPIIY